MNTFGNITLLLLLLSLQVYGQVSPFGLNDPNHDAQPMNRSSSVQPMYNGYLSCFIESDSTFTKINNTPVPGGFNWSSSIPDDTWCGPIPLPFDFYHYTDTFHQVYINTNGTLSFSGSSPTYLNQVVPYSPVITPFRSDLFVPVNNPESYVSFKIMPNYMIINWNNIMPYGPAGQNPQSFQVIISNGTDSLLPFDYNISIRYKDMFWTTGGGNSIPPSCTYNGINYSSGDAFCGTGATVAVSGGQDSSTYFEIGRFDHPGYDYNSPLSTSGVDWLDNRTFFVNSRCNNIEEQPIAFALQQYCVDTVRMCLDDTMHADWFFIDPSYTNPLNSQATLLSGTGLSSQNVSLGTASSLEIDFLSSSQNTGLNFISISAYRGGSSPDTIDVELPIDVISSDFNLSVTTSNDTICSGNPITLSAQGADSYLWSTGDTGSVLTHIPIKTTTYNLLASNTIGCTKIRDIPIIVNPTPSALIWGDTVICKNEFSSAYLQALGLGTYSWSNGSFDTTLIIQATESFGITLYVTNSYNCTDSAYRYLPVDTSAYIHNKITGPDTYVPGEIQTYTLANPPVGASFNWSSNGATILSGQGTTSVQLSMDSPTGVTIIVQSTSSTCYDSDVKYVTKVTSVESITDLSDIVYVYPNPVHDYVVIDAEKLQITYDIQLLDAVGKVLYNYRNRFGTFRIDISELSASTYYLKISTADGKVKVIHVVKQ